MAEAAVLVVDDILLFPVRSILWIFKQIHGAAEQEMEHMEERLTAELSELYMRLDTGRITEAEFEAREKEILDKLDNIQDYKRGDSG